MAKYSKRITDHQKRKLLEEFYSSNYSIHAFCRLNGLNRSTFSYWLNHCEHLHRGIVATLEKNRRDRNTESPAASVEIVEDSSSLIRIGATDLEEEASVIDIPQEILSPTPRALQKDSTVKNTLRISSPIRLSLGRICIELDEGCSALEFKNIITVLNGAV